MPRIEDIADLVAGTLKELGRFKWTDLAHSLTEYPGAQQVLKRNRLAVSSGYGMQWNLQTDTNGGAVEVGLNAVDNVNIVDTMVQATDVLRNITNAWAIDEREITANTGEAQVFDLVKTRRAAAHGDVFKLLESRIWDCPLSTDTNAVRGLLYYIVKDDTKTAGGFTTDLPVTRGQASSGFTTIAGVVPSTANKWHNYAHLYANVSKSDLVKAMRRSMYATNFMSPVEIPTYVTAPDYGIYTNQSVILTFEELLEAQNQSLGNDLDSKGGMVVFRRQPVRYVPQLDSHTKNPVIGVNWGAMKWRYLQGEYFRETMSRAALQHRTVQHFIDLTIGLECYDRRRQWICQTA